MLDGDDSPIPRDNRNHKLVKDAIDVVAALHREWIETRIKSERERFSDARAEAEEAARVAWAADVAGAADAADAAWVADVAWAAEEDAYQTMKDKLIELLSEAGHTQTRDDCKK